MAWAGIVWLFVVSTSVGQVTESPTKNIRVIHIQPAEPWGSYRQSIPAGLPGLRGFRFPMLDRPQELWPVRPPGQEMPEPLRQAAELVGLRLAKDGLLNTVSQAIQIIGPANFGTESDLDTLRAAGLPVDLLDYFEMEGAKPGRIGIVGEITRLLAGGERGEALRDRLAAARFVFRPSHQGFRLASESGEGAVSCVRLQTPTAAYWRGPGDGSAIDVLRQFVETWTDAAFMVAVEEKNVPAFVEIARSWPLQREAQLTVLAAPWPVEQWAQDNGKPGYAVSDADGRSASAILVPRFANRGEERTVLDADSSMTIRALSQAGPTLVSSPLIFQGGNLLPVRDPAAGRRILLIGEAEIYRNTALGLTRDQVLDAFKIECGVDQCLVVPALSFHLDFELCVRAHQGKLVAFINDDAAAARIILSLGTKALIRKGLIDARKAEDIRKKLADGSDRDAVGMLAGPSQQLGGRDGYYRAGVAEHFASGTTDSGAANLQRYLLALDILASLTTKPDELPNDPFTRSYIGSLQRRRTARQAFHQQLAGFGWLVVPVPSLADEELSINYLNGFHELGRYILPAWGGFYAPLDTVAANAFRVALGKEVQIVPIFCAESQRRLGAIHCTASVWPQQER